MEFWIWVGLYRAVPVSTHSWESVVLVAGVAPEEGAEEVLEGSGWNMS